MIWSTVHLVRCKCAHFWSTRPQPSTERGATMETDNREWKRNFGYITLAVTSVLMVGWIRSVVVNDNLQIPRGKYAEESVSSSNGILSWNSSQATKPNSVSTRWESSSVSSRDLERYDRDTIWSFQSLGIGLGIVQPDTADRRSFQIRQIPYWMLVIPLGILSAWLILSEPQIPNDPNESPNGARSGHSHRRKSRHRHRNATISSRSRSRHFHAIHDRRSSGFHGHKSGS